MMNFQQPREEPITRVRTRTYSSSNTPLAIVSGLIVIIGIILSIIYFNFSALESLILIASLFIFYALLLILLISMSKKTSRVIRREVVKEVEKPVIKVVEKPIVKVVEKPVIRIVEKPRKMPKAKHYKYVGSTTSKIYHESHSRLARLIRPKNRIHSNSKAYFERLGFKPSEHIKTKLKKSKKKN